MACALSGNLPKTRMHLQTHQEDWWHPSISQPLFPVVISQPVLFSHVDSRVCIKMKDLVLFTEASCL